MLFVVCVLFSPYAVRPKKYWLEIFLKQFPLPEIVEDQLPEASIHQFGTAISQLTAAVTQLVQLQSDQMVDVKPELSASVTDLSQLTAAIH